ncbi:hypothetical protein [Coleofasciculus sp. FACHB-T130]|uniref:hypothetical protein n=1 Tax=Cyanophyceae TaxID=3028117 RepID=UPI0016849CC7|nr:hypothetical protein [Coleofasciculus sp. FACHB-T130]MBD1879203.1 hypothetical protein [Coleofasciculus sp. FACHB-T130]
MQLDKNAYLWAAIALPKRGVSLALTCQFALGKSNLLIGADLILIPSCIVTSFKSNGNAKVFYICWLSSAKESTRFDPHTLH